MAAFTSAFNLPMPSDLRPLAGRRRLIVVLADFAREGELVRVRDAQGPIATLATGPARVMPIGPLRLPAVGFGQVDGQRVFLPGRARGRPAPGSLRVVQWSDRLPPLAQPSGARRAFVVDPCTFSSLPHPAGPGLLVR